MARRPDGSRHKFTDFTQTFLFKPVVLFAIVADAKSPWSVEYNQSICVVIYTTCVHLAGGSSEGGGETKLLIPLCLQKRGLVRRFLLSRGLLGLGMSFLSNALSPVFSFVAINWPRPKLPMSFSAHSSVWIIPSIGLSAGSGPSRPSISIGLSAGSGPSCPSSPGAVDFSRTS